jgi:hypothetical protein
MSKIIHVTVNELVKQSNPFVTFLIKKCAFYFSNTFKYNKPIIHSGNKKPQNKPIFYEKNSKLSVMLSYGHRFDQVYEERNYNSGQYAANFKKGL